MSCALDATCTPRHARDRVGADEGPHRFGDVGDSDARASERRSVGVGSFIATPSCSGLAKPGGADHVRRTRGTATPRLLRRPFTPGERRHASEQACRRTRQRPRHACAAPRSPSARRQQGRQGGEGQPGHRPGPVVATARRRSGDGEGDHGGRGLLELPASQRDLGVPRAKPAAGRTRVKVLTGSVSTERERRTDAPRGTDPR